MLIMDITANEANINMGKAMEASIVKLPFNLLLVYAQQRFDLNEAVLQLQFDFLLK